MADSIFNEELFVQVETLVDEGDIEAGSAPYRTAQQVIETGYDSLSPPQRALFETAVAPALARLKARAADSYACGS